MDFKVEAINILQTLNLLQSLITITNLYQEVICSAKSRRQLHAKMKVDTEGLEAYKQGFPRFARGTKSMTGIRNCLQAGRPAVYAQ